MQPSSRWAAWASPRWARASSWPWGRKINLKERSVLQEALNLDSAQGILRFLKSIFLMTLCFEGAGAALSFLVFVQDYPPLRALWISIFHSVAAFNNSGFDILGKLPEPDPLP